MNAQWGSDAGAEQSSRRSWLGGAAASLGAAGLGLLGCAQGAQPGAPAPLQSADAPTPAGFTSGPLTRIGVASCINQNAPQPIWDAVLAYRPDLFLFGGDNVYASDIPWSRGALEAAYAKQGAVPGFARLRREIPHLAIWDDHDYGSNDGGAEFAQKSESKDEFLRFWQVSRGDPRRTREGLYHAQIYGPPGQRVQVILLDVRWFRSPWKPTDQRGAVGKERYLPDLSPEKTMLGEAQWRWLAEQLRQEAEVRLVVSGIQVVADGHGWEGWAMLPRERARLYALIRETHAQGVLFLSGDRHIGAIYEERRGVPYPMVELTSSGVTHPWRTASEPGPNRVALDTDFHFGSVDIDWPARRVVLALRGLDGKARFSHSLALSALS